jgi:hypothetical protein
MGKIIMAWRTVNADKASKGAETRMEMEKMESVGT